MLFKRQFILNHHTFQRKSQHLTRTTRIQLKRFKPTRNLQLKWLHYINRSKIMHQLFNLIIIIIIIIKKYLNRYFTIFIRRVFSLLEKDSLTLDCASNWRRTSFLTSPLISYIIVISKRIIYMTIQVPNINSFIVEVSITHSEQEYSSIKICYEIKNIIKIKIKKLPVFAYLLPQISPL